MTRVLIAPSTRRASHNGHIDAMRNFLMSDKRDETERRQEEEDRLRIRSRLELPDGCKVLRHAGRSPIIEPDHLYFKWLAQKPAWALSVEKLHQRALRHQTRLDVDHFEAIGEWYAEGKLSRLTPYEQTLLLCAGTLLKVRGKQCIVCFRLIATSKPIVLSLDSAVEEAVGMLTTF